MWCRGKVTRAKGTNDTDTTVYVIWDEDFVADGENKECEAVLKNIKSHHAKEGGRPGDRTCKTS